MAHDRREQIKNVWLYSYPLVVSITIYIGLDYIGFDVTANKIEKLIDASINLASILVGFLGALFGILISVKNAPIVSRIFQSDYKDSVFHFIKYSIISGFGTVIVAAALYVHSEPEAITKTSHILFFLWLISCFNLILSSYRIIDLLMYIIANSDVQTDRKAPLMMSEQAVEELKKDSARSNSE